jgi:hypothetical protein
MSDILDSPALEALAPDRVFDGGDMDCGSGLALLIRENMLQIPLGAVLELRSRDATVADDLPPWCRLSGHAFLGRLPGGPGESRYFMKRGAAPAGGPSEAEALAADKEKAKGYEWRLRVRATGDQKRTGDCPNFAWDLGQAASFEEKDAHPCAVEACLGALGAALSSAFAVECSQGGLELDDIEITVRGRLGNILAHLGLEQGDPSFAAIEVKCYATTLDDEGKVRAAWEGAVARSPLAATLAKAVPLTVKFAVA